MLGQFFQDAFQTPSWGGVLGTSIWEETPGQTRGYAGQIMYHGWTGNALGFPWWSWWKWLVTDLSKLPSWSFRRPHPRPGYATGRRVDRSQLLLWCVCCQRCLIVIVGPYLPERPNDPWGHVVRDITQSKPKCRTNRGSGPGPSLEHHLLRGILAGLCWRCLEDLLDTGILTNAL